MHLIPLDDMKPGMRLARTIYREDDGGVLLRPNIELKPTYITRIKELKYSHIYILDPNDSEESIIYDQVDDETRFKTRSCLKKVIKLLEHEESVNLRNLFGLVEEMISQIFSKLDFVYNIVDIRSVDNYIYAHSVNVCVIALMIGSEMGLNRLELAKLGVGALLHDVGMLFCNSNNNKNSNFADTLDQEIEKKHSRVGYELLKRKTELNFLSAHITLQHHEREDGTGYPRGLNGKRIHRYAKIVAVADTFDKMVYRGYYKGIPPFEAIKDIKKGVPAKFERSVVDGFTKIMAPYPIGSVLLLNNGETVVVEFVSRFECLVKVLVGNEEGKVYDFYHTPKVNVIKYCV